MKRTLERTVKINSINAFGAVGYLFCFLQWLWTVLLYFSVIQPAISHLAPEANEKTYDVPNFSVALPGPIETIIIVVVVAVMVAVTVYVLVKLPMNIVKTSSKVAYKATATAVPVTIKVQHKKDTKKNRIALTPKVLVVVKLCLLIIPVALTVGSMLLEKLPIDYSIAVVVGGGLASTTGLFFIAQYLLALALHIKLSELK